MKAQYETRMAKVEVLMNYWGKITYQIWDKAAKKGDKVTKEMISLMNAVPRDVKAAVLEAYINRCRQRHNVAFLQWRYRFPHERTFVRSDLEVLI